MALRIASQDTLPTSRALTLEGRLDNETAEELNDVLARELPPQIKVLVFDLQHLTYISSMELRISSRPCRKSSTSLAPWM
jgi:anti-anti-sigma regulatory factor